MNYSLHNLMSTLLIMVMLGLVPKNDSRSVKRLTKCAYVFVRIRSVLRSYNHYNSKMSTLFTKGLYDQ